MTALHGANIREDEDATITNFWHTLGSDRKRFTHTLELIESGMN
jgi:hypothetical protein